MQIRICFDTQHMFVMLMHTILCNTSNNGSSREISFTRDKTGVKPSTLERSLHRQCVRRCISVDHRWIIFHLITRQLLRADESQGIKNLIPHKNTSVLAKKKVEVQKSDCQILSMRIGRRWENQWQRRWEAMVVTARIVWRNLEEISSDEISERNRLWVSCLPPPLPGGNRAVICGHWWFLWPPRNPRK